MPAEAEAVQGGPAGLASRLLAAAVDAIVVGSLLVATYAGAAVLLFAWNPRTFTLPNWPAGLVLALAGSLELGYLTLAWWIGGRSYGCVLMGLRVVDSAGATLPLRRAFVRALLCTLFPLGLAWCAVDARSRAVHDVVARSRAVYDWRQRARAGP
jgi:uncharacterized RDD family membrane protein YckC